tara:strand:+ start:3647 stop:4588 length:942 start_codon:yes stop_codon:yes gene_type:complete
MPQNNAAEKILVIKLSALGDFMQALGPMAAIRKHHPNAHITLLTTKMFKIFGKKCGYFDAVWIDERPKLFDFSKWLTLRKTLLGGDFSRVYDLQNNDRTNLYFKLFPKGHCPEWVGAANGASHQNKSPERIAGTAFDGHRQTLSMAGIQDIEIDPLDWVDEDLSTFALKPPFVLLVPGSAPQHPQKRWPVKSYAQLAQLLNDKGYQIVLLGTTAEKEITAHIAQQCSNCLNLTEQTSLLQIAALARQASAAIGNDTGPMHIIGPTQCNSIVLFSAHSDPKRHAPKGDNVYVLQESNLDDLAVDTVMASFKDNR